MLYGVIQQGLVGKCVLVNVNQGLRGVVFGNCGRPRHYIIHANVVVLPFGMLQDNTRIHRSKHIFLHGNLALSQDDTLDGHFVFTLPFRMRLAEYEAKAGHCPL